MHSKLGMIPGVFLLAACGGATYEGPDGGRGGGSSGSDSRSGSSGGADGGVNAAFMTGVDAAFITDVDAAFVTEVDASFITGVDATVAAIGGICAFDAGGPFDGAASSCGCTRRPGG